MRFCPQTWTRATPTAKLVMLPAQPCVCVYASGKSAGLSPVFCKPQFPAILSRTLLLLSRLIPALTRRPPQLYKRRPSRASAAWSTSSRRTAPTSSTTCVCTIFAHASPRLSAAGAVSFLPPLALFAAYNPRFSPSENRSASRRGLSEWGRFTGFFLARPRHKSRC